MIDMLIGYGLMVLAFAVGWIMRGSLCLRRGGCDAVANDQIAALERQVQILELERAVRR